MNGTGKAFKFLKENSWERTADEIGELLKRCGYAAPERWEQNRDAMVKILFALKDMEQRLNGSK